MVARCAQMSPGQPWLFPGYRGQHTSARQLHRIVRLRPGVPASPSVSAFIRCGTASPRISWSRRPIFGIIQVLLGHKKLDTTALYTRVAISTIGQVTSPLDFLRKMPG